MKFPLNDRVQSSCPRMMVCGLRGGSGKTVVAAGLTRALHRRGLRVAPFKKGPDYIDSEWLSMAADNPCRNLDAFLMKTDDILRSFVQNTNGRDIAVIEGNRGLYDGLDAAGTYSSAELAIQLKTPVVLVLDCTKATRTMAAMVLGCKNLNPDVCICGVILNRVACERHTQVIRSAIEDATGIPVVGVIPKLNDLSFSERHLGLCPPAEHGKTDDVLDLLGDIIEQHVDLDAIQSLAASNKPLTVSGFDFNHRPPTSEIRIGVIRDAAFHFYYPENLEALQTLGAELVEVNALEDSGLPSVDALYIGGGFPEMHAEKLAANRTMRSSIRESIEKGLPVLAECGGLIYLSESILINDTRYPMVGVFGVEFTVGSRPAGHGYTIVQVDRQNPFFPAGTQLRGHEFRYARIRNCLHDMENSIFKMQRGNGFADKRDGLLFKNTLASFCHHHAVSNALWAEGLFHQAAAFKSGDCANARACSGTYG